MEIFIVTMITEEEYCGAENIGVFATRELAEQYIADQGGQQTFEHWSGSTVKVFDIETWEISG